MRTIDAASVPRVGSPPGKAPSLAPEGAARLVKDVLDRLLAATALLGLGPLLLLLAVLVRTTSHGPALFSQTRVGQHGTCFTMLKFRTMHAGAEAQRHRLIGSLDPHAPHFKLRDDPRTTPVGRILRRWSLDELPQLLNVARGHMSLVGPRPALPHELLSFEDGQGRRLSVKPGMTGLWQVSGRSDLSWERCVALDLLYVDTWSLRRDAALLWRTLGAVLTRRGAY